MLPSPNWRRRSLALALVLLTPLLPRVAGGDSPLTEQDVVRWFVSDLATDEIVERIARSDVDFDLSPEMLVELRLAGLPSTVIDAMLARQTELAPPETAEPLAEIPSATLAIPLAVDTPGGTLRVRSDIPPELAEAWDLTREPEARRATDLALVVLCRSATHVPDQWRSETPLGRDFFSAPRHRLLALVSGARSRPGSKGPDDLELRIPAKLEIELDPDEPHDLTLGLALEVAGRYLLWVHDDLDGFVPDRARALHARLEAGPGLPEVDLEVVDSAAADDDEPREASSLQLQ